MNFLPISFLSASAFAEMPGSLHWNADDLADAVPRRVSELYVFAPAASAAAHDLPAARARRGYLPATGPGLFRVRG